MAHLFVLTDVCIDKSTDLSLLTDVKDSNVIAKFIFTTEYPN